MAPKSRIRHEKAEGDLRTLVRRSVTGDAEVSAAQVQKQLEATRQLIAGIIAGLGPAGKTFAGRYQERYAPDAIREMIQAEGGANSLFANAEAKCWKKYTEISTEITQTSIETDVQDAVVKYVENLIRGSS
jgi:hypothetical protein